jgi:hypothetical protein
MLHPRVVLVVFDDQDPEPPGIAGFQSGDGCLHLASQCDRMATDDKDNPRRFVN